MNLLNTIKLPRKLLDIKKRLPKSNYCTPVIVKKKFTDIKIAKGLPEIFDNSISRLSTKRPKASERYSPSTPSSKKNLEHHRNLSVAMKNRLYKRITTQNQPSPISKIANAPKIRLPQIQRGHGKPKHNYSVNYSCRSLSGKRGEYSYI